MIYHRCYAHIVSSSCSGLNGYITDFQRGKLPDGLIAQLVEQKTQRGSGRVTRMLSVSNLIWPVSSVY